MTPADKPDLPAPDYQRVQTDGWEYGTVMHTDYYTADTVLRLLADERRKTLEEAEERLRQRLDAAKHTHAISEGPYSEGMRDAYSVAVLDIHSMTDRKEPTT